MKKYKDIGIYDFSDYAEEITGNALFKINGGAEVENSDKGVAGAKPGDTITRKNGDVIVLKQADIDYANAQLGNNGNDGTGNTNGNSGTGNNSNSGSNNTSNSRSTNNSSSGANNTGISNTSTSESTPEVSEEIKQNSNAYAYYMSLQGRAKEEGNPDKYKGYNVLGCRKMNIRTILSQNISPQVAFDETDFHCDIYSWNSAVENNLDPRGQNGETPDLNDITVSTFYSYFPNHRSSTPENNTRGYMFYDDTNDNIDNPTHMEYYDYSNSNSNTYTQYQTNGINPQRQVQRGIAETDNINWTFVPLNERE